jgi:hypothetical protein
MLSTKKKIMHTKKNLLIIVGPIKISGFEIDCKYHNGLNAENIILNNKNKIDKLFISSPTEITFLFDLDCSFNNSSWSRFINVYKCLFL